MRPLRQVRGNPYVAHLLQILRSKLAGFRNNDPEVRRRLRQQLSAFLISAGLTLTVLTATAYQWMRSEQTRLLAHAAPGVVAPQDHREGIAFLLIPKIKVRA